jgi:hypothetical protein
MKRQVRFDALRLQVPGSGPSILTGYAVQEEPEEPQAMDPKFLDAEVVEDEEVTLP